MIQEPRCKYTSFSRCCTNGEKFFRKFSLCAPSPHGTENKQQRYISIRTPSAATFFLSSIPPSKSAGPQPHNPQTPCDGRRSDTSKHAFPKAVFTLKNPTIHHTLEGEKHFSGNTDQCTKRTHNHITTIHWSLRIPYMKNKISFKLFVGNYSVAKKCPRLPPTNQPHTYHLQLVLRSSLRMTI